MIKAHLLDSIQNAKRAAVQEIDDILGSGCMSDCKLHNLHNAVDIVYHACQIEAMNIVGEAIATNYVTKKVLTPSVKNSTVETVTTIPSGTTIVN